MNVTVYNKFTQHKDLKHELLATGDAELIEVRETCRVRYSSRRLTDLRRTRTKMRSGVVGQMEKEGICLGRPLNVFVLNCVTKSDDDYLSQRGPTCYSTFLMCACGMTIINKRYLDCIPPNSS